MNVGVRVPVVAAASDREQSDRPLPDLADRGNVEAVAPGPGPNELTMRVWERGVGETLACGTGAAAAAWAAARQWGLVGDDVTVRQPGGPARVHISGDRITLTGPSEFIATVETTP